MHDDPAIALGIGEDPADRDRTPLVLPHEHRPTLAVGACGIGPSVDRLRHEFGLLRPLGVDEDLPPLRLVPVELEQLGVDLLGRRIVRGPRNADQHENNQQRQTFAIHRRLPLILPRGRSVKPLLRGYPESPRSGRKCISLGRQPQDDGAGNLQCFHTMLAAPSPGVARTWGGERGLQGVSRPHEFLGLTPQATAMTPATRAEDGFPDSLSASGMYLEIHIVAGRALATFQSNWSG